MSESKTWHWYKFSVPAKYNLTSEGYFGQGFGTFFVIAKNKEEALKKGFAQFKQMRGKYEGKFGVPKGVQMNDFKVVQISEATRLDENLPTIVTGVKGLGGDVTIEGRPFKVVATASASYKMDQRAMMFERVGIKVMYGVDPSGKRYYLFASER